MVPTTLLWRLVDLKGTRHKMDLETLKLVHQKTECEMQVMIEKSEKAK